MQANGSAYSRSTLKIYRYELPWHVAFATEQDDGLPTYDNIYGSDDRFNERFFDDWAVRTENPFEANLFYVPMMAIYTDNENDMQPHMHAVMSYIKASLVYGV